MPFRRSNEETFQDPHVFPDDVEFSHMTLSIDQRQQGGAPRTRHADREPLSPQEESTPVDETNLLPLQTWIYSDAAIIVLYVMLTFLLLSIAGFCLWGGLRTDDEGDCQARLVELGDRKTSLKIRFVRESVDLLNCLNFCNTSSCDSCCPACDGFPAPLPPPSGHPDNPGITTTSDDCPNWQYGAFASAAPSELCRFGPLAVAICGFANDDTISVLETPLTVTPQFAEGTALASVPRTSLANGLLCKENNAVTGPNGLSRFTVRGDQTGFSIRFVAAVSASGPCPSLVCPSVI